MMRTLLLVIVVACLAGAEARAQLGQIGKGVSIAKKANDVRDLQMTDAEEQQLGAAVSERIRTRYGVVQDPAVRDTIQRDSARQAEIPHSGLAMDMMHHSQQDFLGHFLDRGSNVHVERVGDPRLGHGVASPGHFHRDDRQVQVEARTHLFEE